MSTVTRSTAKRLDLPPNPRIRYTRKSTEEADKQIASHEQQIASMDRQWSPTNTSVHFHDDYTGTTFERPAFRQMREFCRINRQVGASKGVIECYDMTRWGRILTDGDEDPLAMMEEVKKFQRWGWEVRFLNIQNTGDPLLDFFQQGLHSYMAAAYSKKLSRDVRRGRDHFLTLPEGARWLGGDPPLGTHRVDPETGTILNRKERASRGGSILMVNEQEMAYLIEGGKMLLANATYAEIANYWNTNGVRTEWGNRWEHRAVQLALSNPALIGEMHIEHIDPKSGNKTIKVYRTQWEPLIDTNHFNLVRAEVERRQRKGKVGPRTGFTKSLLAPVCSRCGLTYYATRMGKRVCYVHPQKDSRTNLEWVKLMEEHACRHWYVDAPLLEEAIMQLILERRTSDDFVAHLNAIIEERGDLEASATREREEAERRLQSLTARQRLTAQNMTRAQESGIDDKLFWETLKQLQTEIAEVQQARDGAIELEKMANSAWDSVRDLIDETKNLESIWRSGDYEKRRQLLDWWVRQIVIVVDQEPLKRRATAKFALVFLRTAPTEGIDMLVSGSSNIVEGTKGTRTTVNNVSIGFAIELPRFQESPDAWRERCGWVAATATESKQVAGIAPPPYKRRRAA